MATKHTLRTFAIAIAITSSLSLASCDNVGPRGTSPELAQAKPVAVTGTVVFRDRDGGFFGILTDNGGQFEPVELDNQYKTDGLKIKVSGRLDDSHLGKHAWGNPVQIEKIQVVKD